MKILYFLPVLTVFAYNQLLAQNNYVATSPLAASPGADNTLVGGGTGNTNMSGASNVFVGRAAGTQNMAGTQNVFLGASAGYQNTAGQANVFMGFSAGYTNTSGNNNTFLGVSSGYTNSTGYNNTFSGYRAGYFNSQGANNAFFGSGAGYSTTQGNNNTFIGADAGSTNTTGENNVFLGSLSGASNVSGVSNTFIGVKSGINNNASENTFLGYQAGLNSLGNSNLFLGVFSGYSSANSTASYNTCIGQRTGYNLTSGLANLFLGSNAGYTTLNGNYNTFIGNSAGQQNSSGSGNTAIGDGAGYNNNANLNIYIGAHAGFYNQSGQTNVFIGNEVAKNIISGSDNTFIGSNVNSTGGNAGNLTNATAIGANAQVSVSNAVILGNNANVGIGTSAPAAKLEISSGVNGNSGLRLTNLTRAHQAIYTNQTKFLTVDDQGNLVLASTTSSPFRLAGMAADSAGLWTTNGDNLQNTNAGGVVIGSGVGKTPTGYKLYVSEGILTEKVKVAIKSTADWSDRVFEPGYRLRPLGEVARFISEQKHLPGVPSAQEVVKEGVDVGQMQAKLLEKVEELTLYIIDLKKEQAALKQQNRKLEQRINRLTKPKRP